MSKQFRRSAGTALKIILVTLMVFFIIGSGAMIWLSMQVMNPGYDGKPLANMMKPDSGASVPETVPVIPTTEAPTEPETTEPPTTLPLEAEHVVSTATIAATGDMLMHKPVIDTAARNDGTYDFDYIFKYIRDYYAAPDYSIANLETTFAGPVKPYQGNPLFNCPDPFGDSLKNVGFDMLLTANNHSYDTGADGFFRTVRVVREKGMATLGTMLDGDEPKYSIQNINGINVGMLCYTYSIKPNGGLNGRVYLNGLLTHEGAEAVVNAFDPSNPAPMYSQVEQSIAEMKAQGAEAIVMFLHWGVEYTTDPVAHQYTIAQQLCNLGVDVIVGGHPHVVEPIQLLTSKTDPNHKTVCLYSMGNALSNQRLGNIKQSATAHTEDGVWFSMTFAKYSDDTVYLEDVNLMPTWVDMRTSSARKYYILPLDIDRIDSWTEMFELDNPYTKDAAKRSYDRTMAIVGKGLEESKAYLASQKEQREADYIAAVQRALNAA